MKKSFIAASALALATFTCGAFASDGKIDFTGVIVDQGCDVTANSGQPVNLGQVAKSALPIVRSTAAATKFTIGLTNCPDNYKVAQISFDGTQIDNDNSVLALSTEAVSGVEAASGVGIQITEGAEQNVVKLYERTAEYDVTSGSATLDFTARYIRLSDTEVKPGIANAVANFSVHYN